MTIDDGLAASVAGQHGIEEILLEHRRVAGAPSVEIRCRCNDVLAMWDYAEHVAGRAIAALRRELVEEGIDVR